MYFLFIYNSLISEIELLIDFSEIFKNFKLFGLILKIIGVFDLSFSLLFIKLLNLFSIVTIYISFCSSIFIALRVNISSE